MNKIIPLEVKGQKIVQLSMLSIDESNDIRSWLPQNSIQQVEFQGMELNDCIAYETYECWYRTNHSLNFRFSSILDF